MCARRPAHRAGRPALSGFVTTAAGEKLVFSLMLNRYDAPANCQPTDELDDVAVMLARFTGRTEASPKQKSSVRWDMGN
ncbi:MAG: hypothetical protein WDM76_11995 [Limisphaerales bacterium]